VRTEVKSALDRYLHRRAAKPADASFATAPARDTGRGKTTNMLAQAIMDQASAALADPSITRAEREQFIKMSDLAVHLGAKYPTGSASFSAQPAGAMTPQRRAQLLGASGSGRALLRERQGTGAADATFSAHGRGPMTAARRAELLALSGLGRALLRDQKKGGGQ
jgi:hypothetical protein